MFAIVICLVLLINVYLDHLKVCVLRYVCCSECYVVYNECNEPTPCLLQPLGTHGGDVMYFGCVYFGGEVVFLNCDDICMCAVNKRFDSVYVNVQYDEISLTFTAGSVSLYCVCSHVVIFYLSVWLLWYLMCLRWLL